MILQTAVAHPDESLASYFAVAIVIAGVIGQWAVAKHQIKEIRLRREEDKAMFLKAIEKNEEFFNRRIDFVQDDIKEHKEKTEEQYNWLKDGITTANQDIKSANQGVNQCNIHLKTMLQILTNGESC